MTWFSGHARVMGCYHEKRYAAIVRHKMRLRQTGKVFKTATLARAYGKTLANRYKRRFAPNDQGE